MLDLDGSLRLRSGQAPTRPHTDLAASHAVVVRTAATFGRDPGDDLVGIRDVAGLAVDAIRWIQADAFAVGLRAVVHHLVNIRRTEILARVAEFFHAARVADIGVVNDQVRGLVFFVLGAGVVEVGELVEGQLAIAFRRTEQVGFVAAVRGQFGELLQPLVSQRSRDSGRAGRGRR